MTTSPPPEQPGPGLPPAAPSAAPPAPANDNEFDDNAPTSVVPGRGPRPDMPREFDEGGALDEAPTKK